MAGMHLLTDREIKAAAPGEKPRRMSDGAGLYLLVRPSGEKWWRFDYRHAGKDKALSMGISPSARSSWPKVSAGHAERTRLRLEQNVYPWLGPRSIGTIKPPELLECLRRVADRGGLETAHRVKQAAGQVFRYGIATGACERDITDDLRDALPPALVARRRK